MRKNKTWEITLTDNSKLIANEPIENAVFYTSDTEAYLNFSVVDSGFEFDSATIAMLNKDDGSIIERPMDKEEDMAVYEIESDVMPHFGLWQAQVLFKQGNEIFTSTPVTLTIERYMMSEQPPRLEDVASWQRLYDNATETIQELTRINDELITTNQTVQEAEDNRASAESARVSAEEQRKIDHANRSAELAGKADKAVLKNLIENGDFSDGLKGWSGISNDELMSNKAVINHSGDSARYIYYKYPRAVGDLTYSRAKMKVISNPNSSRVSYLVNGINNSIMLPKDGEEIILSGRELSITTGRSVNQLTLMTGNAFVAEVSEFISINLTQTYGAGNEPTKEEMDELIKITGYIDREYALNNKEMLIWTLALIRRNTSAIISLGGA